MTVPCICSICLATVGSSIAEQRVVCRNWAWPSAETAAMQPALSFEKGSESERGEIFFVAVQFCNDTSIPLNWIWGYNGI